MIPLEDKNAQLRSRNRHRHKSIHCRTEVFISNTSFIEAGDVVHIAIKHIILKNLEVNSAVSHAVAR
jgi:hypothetical protein